MKQPGGRARLAVVALCLLLPLSTTGDGGCADPDSFLESHLLVTPP